LDPAVQNRGRKGLGNASQADKQTWDEIHNNWEDLTKECELLLQKDKAALFDEENKLVNYNGETRNTVISVRIGQQFFRKAVLSSYLNVCCISGVSIPQLLVASHIIPWAESKENRLNPSNGLCLSAIHDKAFDKGFLTITPDYTILISDRLKEKAGNSQQIQLLIKSDKNKITLPHKFFPNKDFLEWHNRNIFLE
jgi:predicted restriction endonuclease